MPVKRSRIGRSSSFGDIGVLSPPVESDDAAPIKRPTKASKDLKPSVGEKCVESSTPPRILTLSSPVQESVGSSERDQVGDFLHRCYHCKKRINENAEVFMYSYLRAFCTAECRDRQIAIDNEMEKASRTLKGMQLSPTK